MKLLLLAVSFLALSAYTDDNSTTTTAGLHAPHLQEITKGIMVITELRNAFTRVKARDAAEGLVKNQRGDGNLRDSAQSFPTVEILDNLHTKVIELQASYSPKISEIEERLATMKKVLLKWTPEIRQKQNEKMARDKLMIAILKSVTRTFHEIEVEVLRLKDDRYRDENLKSLIETIDSALEHLAFLEEDVAKR